MIARRAALALVASLAGGGGALAHAFLERASPAVGSTVRMPPGEVRLWFSEQLEPAFSTVRVLDQGGRAIDRGDARVDPAERAAMRVSLPVLAPGSYTVRWHALSVDTHATDGAFTFRYQP